MSNEADIAGPGDAHIEASPTPALNIDPVVFAGLWSIAAPLKVARGTDSEIEVRARRFQVNTETPLQFRVGYAPARETRRSRGEKNAAAGHCREA